MSDRPRSRGRQSRARATAGLRPPQREPVQMTVEVVAGDITVEDSPVAVIGRFTGLSMGGADRQFDLWLDGWLSRAVDLGAIGSDLGQLFFVPIPESSSLPMSVLLLAGMGEPGRFGRDELRLLMTNVGYAVVALGHRQFSTLLIGSGAGGLVGRRALLPMLEGLTDALARLPTHTQVDALHISLVDRNPQRAQQWQETLVEIAGTFHSQKVQLQVEPRVRPGQQPPEALEMIQPAAAERDPRVPTTRITALIPSPERAASAEPIPTSTFVRLQYSALGAGAVLPVREIEVQRYFLQRLPGILSRRPDKKDEQERYGRLLAHYLIPEDIRQLMFDSPALTLVVDRRTAAFPWEMAALERRGQVSFLGVEPGISRQFRSLANGARAVAPALNDSLRVLIIADPAPGRHHLPQARDEGLAVARVMQQAKDFWGGLLDLKVTVRVGSPEGSRVDDAQALLAAASAFGDAIESAKLCDPLEVLSLLANEEYDIIHYAGHGIYAADTGRSGWVFGPDCLFSANELLRSRRVPRLLFANACHSSSLGEQVSERPLSEQATLAEAFFARGVHNYIGTGWEVADDRARQLAVIFYELILGMQEPTAPPAVLGEALRRARSKIWTTDDSTWGAYQHYG